MECDDQLTGVPVMMEAVKKDEERIRTISRGDLSGEPAEDTPPAAQPRASPYEFIRVSDCALDQAGAGVFDALCGACVVRCPDPLAVAAVEASVREMALHRNTYIQTKATGRGASISRPKTETERAVDGVYAPSTGLDSESAAAAAEFKAGPFDLVASRPDAAPSTPAFLTAGHSTIHAVMFAVQSGHGGDNLVIMDWDCYIRSGKNETRMEAARVAEFIRNRVFDTYNLARLFFVGYPVGGGSWRVLFCDDRHSAVLVTPRCMRDVLRRAEEDVYHMNEPLAHPAYINYTSATQLVFKPRSAGAFARITKLDDRRSSGFALASFLSISLFYAVVVSLLAASTVLSLKTACLIR